MRCFSCGFTGWLPAVEQQQFSVESKNFSDIDRLSNDSPNGVLIGLINLFDQFLMRHSEKSGLEGPLVGQAFRR